VVYLPEWLRELIDETCPLEDRTPDRRVFQGITEASFYQAMPRACKAAKIPHYSPHSLDIAGSPAGISPASWHESSRNALAALEPRSASTSTAM
jgi:hypothetical protein